MMKELVVFLFVVCMGVGSLLTQLAKICFINTPDSLSPLFTAVSRADFIDFLENKMKAEATNCFGGKSETTGLISDYTCVQVTPRSSQQIKLPAVNSNTRLICTVSTVCVPVCGSHIDFYTTDWRELPSTSYLPSVPDVDNFIIPASNTADVYRYQDALFQADVLLMKVDLSSKDATLTFTFATPDYMEKEAAEKLKSFLRRPVSYIWKEGKFVLAK